MNDMIEIRWHGRGGQGAKTASLLLADAAFNTGKYIQGSEHIPPEPEKVPNLMMYYIYNYNHDEQDIFTKIAKYHIEFERIHPFEDGNGRTGRLLINYELLKNDLPPIVIVKEDRVMYFEFLRNNDSNGLAKWLKELSTREEERLERFGYKI